VVISRLAGTVVVLRSEARGGHGVTFPMRCRNGTRDALGTSVTIEAGGRKQRALVHSGVTYLSQCDRRIHSGLGAAAWVGARSRGRTVNARYSAGCPSIAAW
jgi:hypothetical protein